MASGNRKIAAELAMVALIVASLGGTLHLVVSVHRRALTAKRTPVVPAPTPPAVVDAAPAPKPEPPKVAVVPKRVKEPKPAPAPAPPPEDPTPRAVAQLSEAAAREAEEAAKLDREVGALEQARRAAVAESERWRRREMLVQQQVAALTKQAQKLDREVDAYAAQRDVLARERDALKAAHASAPGEGSYAVLPYLGENGTWRRPIVIECTAGEVAIRPDGPKFTMLELSGLANPRSSPVVVAIARELLKVQTSASPDGSPVVPYFVFLVRPDGIRSYYEVRARLEPLGIAFGYELIDRDLKVDVPNFDDLATWDGSPSVAVPPTGMVQGLPGGAGGNQATPEGRGVGGPVAGGGLSWPGPGGPAAGGAARGEADDRSAIAGAFAAGRGRGGTRSEDPAADAPDDFVWPTSRPGQGDAASSADQPAEGEGGGQGDGDLGGFGVGRATRGLPAPGRAPAAAGNSRRGLNANAGTGSGLGAVVDRLPDFESPGAGLDRGPGSKPEATDEPGGGDQPAGGAPGSMAPPAGLTVPGRSWRSDGSGKPKGGAGVELRPAPAASPALAAAGAGGGLMWGGGRPSFGPATSDGEAQSGGENAPPGKEPTTGSDAGPAGMGRGSGAGGSPPSSPARMAGGAPTSALSGTPPPQAGGLRLGLGSVSGAASSGGAGSPGLMLGADPGLPAPTQGAGGAGAPGASGPNDPEMEPLVKGPDEERPPAIEVPFEIVVACREDGVTIQPGNYRVTARALRDRKDEKLLVRNLAAVAQRRADVDPAIRPRPRIKFLVETDGASTFWEARRQLLFSELGWPMTLQVAGAQNTRLLERGVW